MIKEIKYTGFTATPSDYECPDGELDAAINLVPEEGELHPVQEGEVVLDLEEEGLMGYEPIYIHTNSSPKYKHIILINRTTGKLIWLNEEKEQSWLCGSDIIDTTIKEVVSIGNTLVFLTDESTYYTLWEDKHEDYTYLGKKLPELPISFGLQATHIAKYIEDEGNTYNEFVIGEDGYVYDHAIPLGYFQAITGEEEVPSTASTNIYDIDPVMVDWFTERLDGEVRKFLEDECAKKNKFGLPFLIRCAYRLKGDKGWINRSSPVLMTPWTIPELNVNHYHSSNQRVTSMAVSVHTFAADVDYAVFGDNTYAQRLIDELKRWGDIVEAVDIFVSPPMYFWQYDKKIKYIINRNDYWEDHYNIPRLNISKWLATPAGTAVSDQHVNDAEFYDVVKEPRFNEYDFRACFAYESKTEDEIRDIVVNESRFYRVASIKIEDLETGRHVITLDEGALESLEGRKSLNEEGAAHDHNSYAYGGGFAYNSRLMFYDIKKVSGVTEINANTLIPYTNNDTTSYGNLKIYTAIEKAGEKIYKHNNGSTPSTTGLISHDGIPIPFLFLPEQDITDIAVAYTATGSLYSNRYEEYKAQIHKHLYGTYIYMGWDNFVYGLTKYDIETLHPVQGGKHITEQSNELYLSDVNQPFLFSSTNTVDIDAQGIMAVQSAVKALSQGQFGQFPLYVFTDVGVWALEVASDGTFSAVKAVTNDVCINPKSITKLDTSVLFSTDRGIMLLSGSDTVCITDSIFSDSEFKLITPSLTDDVDLLPHLDRLLTAKDASNNLLYPSVTTASGIVPFKKFLPTARMLYDYVHQRIIVYNPDKDYAYIYSLKSKQWGMMESAIKYGINSYPECLAVDSSNKIINLSSMDTNDTRNCLLISRPLKIDAPDVLKTIDTIIQRGQFRKGSVKSILYGSRDLYHWHLVYSSTDHYLRGFRGTPYKYFRIALLCELQKDESLFGCTIQYTPRLTDQPR